MSSIELAHGSRLLALSLRLGLAFRRAMLVPRAQAVSQSYLAGTTEASDHGYGNGSRAKRDPRRLSDQRHRLHRVLGRQRQAGGALLSVGVRLPGRRLSRAGDWRSRSRELPASAEQDSTDAHDGDSPYGGGRRTRGQAW